MQGSIWGSIAVSGLAGLIVGYGVLWLARGSWVARTFLVVLTVACFIAGGIAVKMAFQSAHSESLAPIFFFAVGIYAAAVGVGLLISIFASPEGGGRIESGERRGVEMKLSAAGRGVERRS